MESDDTKTPLHDHFGSAKEPRSPQNYVREDGHALLNDIKALLALSETGAGLLGIAEQSGITVQLLRGREETFFVPEERQVMLMVGPRTQKATPFLALLMAGGIREAQQNLGGFKRPDPYKSPAEEQFITGAGKELDIINSLCLIMGDMEKTPLGPQFLHSMRQLGYHDLYEAHKDGASPEDLMTLLLKKAKKEG